MEMVTSQSHMARVADRAHQTSKIMSIVNWYFEIYSFQSKILETTHDVLSQFIFDLIHKDDKVNGNIDLLYVRCF